MKRRPKTNVTPSCENAYPRGCDIQHPVRGHEAFGRKTQLGIKTDNGGLHSVSAEREFCIEWKGVTTKKKRITLKKERLKSGKDITQNLDRPAPITEKGEKISLNQKKNVYLSKLPPSE